MMQITSARQGLFGDRTAVFCLAALGAILAVALLGPWLSPNDYRTIDLGNVLHPPTHCTRCRSSFS
jgi:ABC-type antimicrobial peptide transport system permease subunit